jgi:hypothetical protein
MKTIDDIRNESSCSEAMWHYPGQVDPDLDKSGGKFITGDPDKPIIINPSDIAGSLDRANKQIEKERGTTFKDYLARQNSVKL